MDDNYIAMLNDRQRAAVEATEGRVRVIAGAGSGKTRVLACRYAYLVEELGVDAASILCLTFTNKAAQEMRQRIRRMVSEGSVNDFVCTIHGFCVKFLREEIFRLGYPKTFMVMDEDDCKSLARHVMEELGIKRTVQTVDQMLAGVAAWKVATPFIDDVLLPGSKANRTNTNDPLIRYLLAQQKNYALDFDDLIHFTLYIMSHYPEVTERWQQRICYLMVDEVQDCNRNDWAIIDTLAAGHGNLFIVGDPDQAIYEWRGAQPGMFVHFVSDTDIVLDENYRSTPDILGVANSIIVRNSNRLEKNLFTRSNNGKKAIHYHGRDEKEECEWVVNQIVELIRQGAAPSDVAVLYRSSYLSRSVEQAMMKQNIPYVVWGGIRFFERKEIKDAISYLRLIAYDDDMSFRRVINTPSRRFGKVSLAKLTALAETDSKSLFATLIAHQDEAPFHSPEVKAFVKLITSMQQCTQQLYPSDLLDDVLQLSGLKEMYRLDGDEERLENIAELLSSVRLYEEDNKEETVTIVNYLQDIALYTNADRKGDSDAVRLMTIHQAKGLEFPYVFVVGMSEGIFPSHRSVRERKLDALEEERRLMYVAVTRAERQLFLTESEGYNYTSSASKFPSRFLREIASNLLTLEGDMDPTLWDGTANMVRALNDEIGCPEPEDESPYAPGTVVTHKVFGRGTVLEYVAERDVCRVQFEKDVKTIATRVLTVD